MRSTLWSTFALFGILVEGASITAQSTTLPVVVEAVTRSPIVLTANSPGSPVGTDSLPPSVTSTTGFNLQATAGGINRVGASVRSRLTIASSWSGASVSLNEAASCAGMGQSAFSTPHDILITIRPATTLLANLNYTLTQSSSSGASGMIEVDLDDDGTIDLVTTQGGNVALQTQVQATASTPVLIAVRASASAMTTTSGVESTLTISLSTRGRPTVAQGCRTGVVLRSNPRLDGGANVLLIDPAASTTPGRIDMLFFGTPLSASIPLPFAIQRPQIPCTFNLAVFASLDVTTNALSRWLEFPMGVPLSLRPVTLTLQRVIALPSGSTHQLDSTEPLSITFL